MENLVELTAQETAQSIRGGKVSRVEVVEAHLDRIAALNDGVNAITQLRRDGALSDAANADRDHARRRGLPLDGVPVVVKDEYDVAGMATSQGSLMLRGYMADRDSTVVNRLRKHGAIVLGKSNQPDFAMRWNTKSSASGWTRNPHDLSLSAGGSSGGDAAAVASGMAKIGFGTDLAGSIRVPAAFCKVYGLRTTPGRVPFDSQFTPQDRTPAVDAMSSQGPLARSVADLCLALSATQGESIAHPISLGRVTNVRPTSWNRRVARLVDQSGAVVDPDVTRQLDAVCGVLADAGYEIEDAAFPHVDRAPDLWGELVCSDLRLTALPHLKDAMDPSCYDHIDKLSRLWPTAATTERYLAKWAERASILRALLEWMEQYPLVISPIAGTATPLLDYDDWVSTSALEAITAKMRNCLWPAMLGLPSVALPQGCQLVARPWHDEDALAAASCVEASTAPVVPVGIR